MNGVLQHTIREFSTARASMGVIGVGVVAVPEPSTSALMGIGRLGGPRGFHSEALEEE